MSLLKSTMTKLWEFITNLQHLNTWNTPYQICSQSESNLTLTVGLSLCYQPINYTCRCQKLYWLCPILLNDGGDTGHPCLPVWSQGVKITSDGVISCSLWMKFITTSTSKISPSAALDVWTFKPPETEGLFRYMERVGLFFKQENTSNP